MYNVFGCIIYCKYAGEDLGKTLKSQYEKQHFNLIEVILLNDLMINYVIYGENFQDISSIQTEKQDITVTLSSFQIWFFFFFVWHSSW